MVVALAFPSKSPNVTLYAKLPTSTIEIVRTLKASIYVSDLYIIISFNRYNIPIHYDSSFLTDFLTSS